MENETDSRINIPFTLDKKTIHKAINKIDAEGLFFKLKKKVNNLTEISERVEE